MSEVDDGRRRRAAAERQKRARTREALGLVVLPIELHEAQIADALIEARLLMEDETTDRQRVAAAAASRSGGMGARSARVMRDCQAANALARSVHDENCDARPHPSCPVR